MKAQRQDAIMRLVRRHRVGSQEQLRRLLREAGMAVTQATLSRDIRELGLVKASDPEGSPYYTLPPHADVLQPRLEQLLPTLLIELDGVGNLLVLRTPAGSANALGSAIDGREWKEVVGTVAGDDTILVITRSDRARRILAKRLGRLAGL